MLLIYIYCIIAFFWLKAARLYETFIETIKGNRKKLLESRKLGAI